ncbi:helix-turn-helix domain-containing protein [Nocardia nova]|uniref:helix-turn-helix domain-containing protein n=1 Tax=Nocardia nova TaxID=37330 RepID=UPI001C67E316|nr:helix-turn-helix transcriptional regulator [Nocardia nova]
MKSGSGRRLDASRCHRRQGSNKPTTVRLDGLNKICTALNCTGADLLEAELFAADEQRPRRKAVGAADTAMRPTPRRRGATKRSLPPN